MGASEALAAKEADRAEAAFLSGMSHEIRAPMTAVIGLNGLALKGGGHIRQAPGIS